MHHMKAPSWSTINKNKGGVWGMAAPLFMDGRHPMYVPHWYGHEMPTHRMTAPSLRASTQQSDKSGLLRPNIM